MNKSRIVGYRSAGGRRWKWLLMLPDGQVGSYSYWHLALSGLALWTELKKGK